MKKLLITIIFASTFIFSANASQTISRVYIRKQIDSYIRLYCYYYKKDNLNTNNDIKYYYTSISFEKEVNQFEIKHFFLNQKSIPYSELIDLYYTWANSKKNYEKGFYIVLFLDSSITVYSYISFLDENRRFWHEVNIDKNCIYFRCKDNYSLINNQTADIIYTRWKLIKINDYQYKLSNLCYPWEGKEDQVHKRAISDTPLFCTEQYFIYKELNGQIIEINKFLSNDQLAYKISIHKNKTTFTNSNGNMLRYEKIQTQLNIDQSMIIGSKPYYTLEKILK